MVPAFMNLNQLITRVKKEESVMRSIPQGSDSLVLERCMVRGDFNVKVKYTLRTCA